MRFPSTYYSPPPYDISSSTIVMTYNTSIKPSILLLPSIVNEAVKNRLKCLTLATIVRTYSHVYHSNSLLHRWAFLNIWRLLSALTCVIYSAGALDANGVKIFPCMKRNGRPSVSKLSHFQRHVTSVSVILFTSIQTVAYDKMVVTFVTVMVWSVFSY